MYFALEASVIEHAATRGWLDELLCASAGKSKYQKWLILSDPIPERDALLLYFLDRLGQEDRFIPQLGERAIETLQAVVQRLLAR